MRSRLSKCGSGTVLFTALLVSSITHAAADDPARLINAVEAAGHDVPSPATLRSSCDDDMLCIARFLKERIGEDALLIPDEHKEPERATSWQRSAPLSISARDTAVVHRFDAEALAARFTEAKIRILDLRKTVDDDLDRMRRAAGLFIGEVQRAFAVSHIGGRKIDWTVAAQRTGLLTPVPGVLVGPETGVAAVLFAVLLKQHADAEIYGEATAASAFLTTDIPVTRGWKLRIPRAVIEVPGQDLEKGVTPVSLAPR